MNLAEEFSVWAKDPRRTNEELYLAELLIEQGHQKWKSVTNAPWSRAYYDAQVAHRKRRFLNPGYRAKLNKEKLEHTVEMWAQIEKVENDRHDDRPVRDLGALYFFPHLKYVRLRTELVDLSGLNAVQNLRELDLRDERLADLSPLARYTEMEELTLWLNWPWPNLASLAELKKIKKFAYRGNLLPFVDVAEFPLVEKATLGWTYDNWIPLRDFMLVPAMPKVRELELNLTTSLHGLERYTQVESLKVGGLFEDLTPIRSLQNLRELSIQGERFRDLTPLVHLPRLRTLKLEREHGLDLTPLSESPSLRKVESRCEVLKTELATLNAALGFVDVSEFLAPEPRPLKPLRFISWDYKNPAYTALKPAETVDEREAFFGDDPLLEPAERKWFAKLVREKLDPFGDEKWIKMNELHSTLVVNIYRADEAISLVEMLEAVHPLLALVRFRWEVVFFVDLNGDPDEDNWEIRDYSVFDAEREREDWEDQQQQAKERQEMLEKEHRLNLRQQLAAEGGSIEMVADDDEPEECDKTVVHEAPAQDEDDDELVDDRDFRVWLRGNFAWLQKRDLEDAEEFFKSVRIEDWHELPEPPEKRPYPG